MNLKKWGSLLTAISMIGSMATYVPTAVSAAETTTVAPLTGTLADTVSYSLDTTEKTLSLSSAKGEEYVIPNCNYSDTEKGILQQIAYDQEKTTEAIIAYVATIVIDEYATDYEEDAFSGVGADAEVKVHCQSKLADKEADLKKLLGDDDVIINHNMVENKAKKNHKCSYGDFVDNSYEAHDFSNIDNEKHTHTCECGKTDKDYKDAGDAVHYQKIHTFVNHYCLNCEGYDESIHDEPSNLEIESNNALTHSIKCNDSKCTYVKTEEPHTWAYTSKELNTTSGEKGADETVNGKTIPAYSHYCSVCGYYDNSAEIHEYKYVKKPVLNEAGTAYELTMVEAGAGETGLVCICGLVESTHKLHNYIKENGFHYCLCGGQEKTGSGAINHIYDEWINPDTGERVSDSSNGVICECGAIKEHDHNSYTKSNIYDDEEAQKHICKCGVDVTAKYHETYGYGGMDSEKHQHYCEDCGAVNPAANGGHSYTINKKVNGEGDALEDDNSEGQEAYALCACGAVNKNHDHEYTLHIGHVHYCTCGDSSTEHNYVENVCTVCGALENHSHTLNSSCQCTVCGEYAHDWQAVTGKKYHICLTCNRKSNATNITTAEIPSDMHTFVADPKTKTHKCACGALGQHDYEKAGATDTCTCECGATNHTNAYNEATKAHYCSKCNVALTHEFNSATDRCKEAKCNALDPAHTTHAFATNAGSDKNNTKDPDGVTIKTGDELCKCGVVIAHELALDPANAGKHDCTHNKVVEGTTTIVTCAYESVAHTYSTTVVSDSTGTKNVAVDFCDDCGAVNPNKLDEAREAYNNATVSTKNDDTYVGKYSTSYLVKLATAAKEVLKYDLMEVTASNWDDPDKTTNGDESTEYDVAFKTSNVDKILLANTPEAQADYTAALAAFNTLYDQLSENAAKGQVTISFVNADGTDHSLRGDFLEDYPRVQYGKANVDTVTIKVVAKAGYQFDGWYSDVAGTTKVSDSIAYPVALTDNPLTYYAKFKANDTVRIALPEGAKYASSITKGMTWSGELLGSKTVNFQIGETVYIANGTSKDFQSFTDVNGYAHVYNARLDGTAITDLNPADCYAFEVTSADTFTLKTFSKAAIEATDEYYIVFKNGNKELAASITDSKSAEGFEPNKPQPTGKTCIGWAYEDDENENVVRLRSITKSGVLVPVFTAQTGLKLDVKNGRFVLSSDATKNNSATGFTYGDIVKLTADKQNAAGKYFSGWYVGDTMVSNLTSFAYPVTATVTIEARYDRDTELVPDSMYTLSSSRKTYDKGQQVVLTANWAMSDDQDDIVDTGYVFAFSEKTASELELEDVDGSTIRKKSIAMTDKIGTHVYTMSLSSADRVNATVSAVFYITYVNADGVKETVYTNVEVVPGLS